jgi:hypothetical protein
METGGKFCAANSWWYAGKLQRTKLTADTMTPMKTIAVSAGSNTLTVFLGLWEAVAAKL